jgi:hypothetical protein
MAISNVCTFMSDRISFDLIGDFCDIDYTSEIESLDVVIIGL